MLIYTYGITLQGTYHAKNNLVCQDYHEIKKCSETLVIAAVADGLGSAAHSDVAAKMAAELSTEYCKNNITPNSSAEEILGTIVVSFVASLRAIEAEAKAHRHDVSQYDTTLTLAVLINDTLYYGHSGDSGIVALTTEGLYEKVTEQQRDEKGVCFSVDI